MPLLRSSLLGSAAAFAAVGAAHAADLPIRKGVPVEYVRVCGAYGAGFFYIPGTDTCLRISGRARFEGGYMTASTRQAGTNAGDSAGYQGRLRINTTGLPVRCSSQPCVSASQAKVAGCQKQTCVGSRR